MSAHTKRLPFSELPAGYAWADLTPQNCAAVYPAQKAAQEFDGSTEQYSAEDFAELLDDPRLDATQHLWQIDTVGNDGASVPVAWQGLIVMNPGEQWARYIVLGTVHPEHRGKGLGTALLGRATEAARTVHGSRDIELPGWLEVYADEDMSATRGLAESLGFSEQRWFTVLTRELSDGGLPEPVLADGIRLTPLTPAHSAQTLAAHNEAWKDHFGGSEMDPETWEAKIMGARSRVPEATLIALDESGPEPQVVGWAQAEAFESDWEMQGYSCGYTTLLSVRRAWRGQGIASALLAAQMRVYAQRGWDRAEIDVDSESPTGANRLYESLGYTPKLRQVMLGLEL